MTSSEFFKYKKSIIGKTPSDGNTKEVEFTVPLRYLRNFWRTLDMPLINCEVNLVLTWSRNCLITKETTEDVDPNVNPPITEIRAPTGATFTITDTILYLTVVTFSTKDDSKLLPQLKPGFEVAIKLN